jgi:uncharacterized protein
MRVAVIADTHLPRGRRRLPQRCIEELERADRALHAGDVVTVEALEEIERLASVTAVAGNMDEPALSERLPERRVVDVAGARIGMVHIPGPAQGRSARLAAWFPGCDAIVFGHTHMPVVERSGDLWILNPGSPTERRRSPSRSMLVLEIDDGQIEAHLIALPG